MTTDNINSTEISPKGGRPGWLNALIKYGIPLIITVGLCYLLFNDFDFNEMVAIIKRDCNFAFIGIALIVSILSHVLRGLRWGIQLRALGVKAPTWVLVFSIFGTYAVNLVFPRLGEVWRTGWIAQRQKAPFTTVFGSMVADRLADTITVLLLTAVTFCLASRQLISYLAQNEQTYRRLLALITSPWLWGAIIAAIIAVWWAMIHFHNNKIVVKIKSIVKDLWDGFAVITKMNGKGRWLLLTIGVWGCYFFQLYIAFFAFPLTSDVLARYGALAVLVCFVLSSISMGVPSNGGIGPWQWAIIFGLSLYPVEGLTREYANSFANLVMGSQTLLLIILGLITFIAISIDKRRQSKLKQ